MVTVNRTNQCYVPKSMGTGWGTVMEGQRLSHAGSHRVAWGKIHTVPVLHKPTAWAMGEITEKQAKGAALVDKGI